MEAPEAPAISTLERISPSLYEASRTCLAKAAWYAFGERRILPGHPASILGTSFHTVIAAANFGILGGSADEVRVAARVLFDKQAKSVYEKMHPLVHAKYGQPERLPYYNLHRERAALYASQVAGIRPAGSFPKPDSHHRRTEMRIESKDGLIVGRPDHIDAAAGTVVDYKSGFVDGGVVVSDAEARQLRLYAYLAMENGVSISRGAIIRGDGHRSEIEIARDDAESEASNARAQLNGFNTAVTNARSFDDLASPSPDNCPMCPCLPFCESFWQDSNPDWMEQCGVQLEGVVKEVDITLMQGVSLVTLAIEPRRGTIHAACASIEHIPERWLTLEGTEVPKVGDVIRVVHARLIDIENPTAILRADKAMTSVWAVPMDTHTNQQ